MQWFKHDTNANRDAKLSKLRIRYGMEGYGLYWYCIELIAEDIDSQNLTFELEHDAEVIAHNTGIHVEQVQEMMSYMVKLGLFENNSGTISCFRLAKRLDQSMTSNPKMRELINNIKDLETSSDNHDGSLTMSCKKRIDKNRYKPYSESSDSRPSVPQCPHQDILDLWAEVMPDKRQPNRSMWPNSARARALSARWKQGFSITNDQTGDPLYYDRDSGIDWWRRFFRFLRTSEFLMRDDSKWFGIDWVCTNSNFAKIMEMKYHGGDE